MCLSVSLRDEVQKGAQWWDSVRSHVPKLDHKLCLELLVNQSHRYGGCLILKKVAIICGLEL